MSANEWSARDRRLLTEIDPRIGAGPFYVSAWTYAIIEVIVREDRPYLRVPRPAKRTLVGDVERVIGLRDVAVVDVDTVMVFKCSIASFPRSNTATAAAELDVRVGHPERTKAIEEVCLPADDAVIHVCAAELTNVDLRAC